MLAALFLAGIALFFEASASPDIVPGACYDPAKETALTKFYGSDFLTDPQVKALLVEAYTKYGVDPRLIFHRMGGEAKGDPDIHNKSSKAYGIFQFLGSPYGSKLTHEQILKTRYGENPTRRKKQLKQLEYYVRDYIRSYASLYAYSGKCFVGDRNDPVGSFQRTKPLTKLLYLGWGSCEETYVKRELVLLDSKEYRNGSDFIQTLKGLPNVTVERDLCPRWAAGIAAATGAAAKGAGESKQPSERSRFDLNTVKPLLPEIIRERSSPEENSAGELH